MDNCPHYFRPTDSDFLIGSPKFENYDNDEKSSQKVSESAETPGCFELLIVTAKQMRKKKQFLLIPLTIWSGLEQGFFGADFTAVRYLSDTFRTIFSSTTI